MNGEQITAIAIVAATMAGFVWGRVRYDIVAALSLLAGVATGIIPMKSAFLGFSDDIVIIVGSALLVSDAVARSGVMEVAINRYFPQFTRLRPQLLLLVISVTVLSGFVKNIGALAIMMPIAFKFARRSNISPSVFLMPMAFGALLGGLVTLIGTSPNIIVSKVRQEMTGQPFTMFDFAPVGGALALTGIIFLGLFYWLVPARQRAGGNLNEAIDIKNYVSEAEVTQDSTIVGKTLGELMKFAEGSAMATAILREGTRRVAPLPDAALKVGDVLVFEGNPEALDRLVAQGRLALSGEREVSPVAEAADLAAIEAVIGQNSLLAGRSAQGVALHARYNINLLAVSRMGERVKARLGEIILENGDVVLLQGDRASLPDVLRQLGCLPLAERQINLGTVRRGLVPLGILGAAMVSTALGFVTVPVAFFGAAVLMVLLRAIPARDVYGAVDGPILVMLAALIPVSDSLRTTGVTEVAAGLLGQMAMGLPAWGALTLIMVAAMAVTPFLNNAATVLVMAPIAASFATKLHYAPEAFLMAVAIGAGCDFLTPIGHQCNTLVMGAGGYRFWDYPRLGLPLSIMVVIVAVPLLMLFWPV